MRARLESRCDAVSPTPHPLLPTPSWPHQRKQNHIPDRRRVRQDHRQAIDADAFAGRWRHAVLEGVDVILVHLHGLVVAGFALAELLAESAVLFVSVVQLRESVRYFHPADVELEAL